MHAKLPICRIVCLYQDAMLASQALKGGVVVTIWGECYLLYFFRGSEDWTRARQSTLPLSMSPAFSFYFFFWHRLSLSCPGRPWPGKLPVSTSCVVGYILAPPDLAVSLFFFYWVFEAKQCTLWVSPGTMHWGPIGSFVCHGGWEVGVGGGGGSACIKASGLAWWFWCHWSRSSQPTGSRWDVSGGSSLVIPCSSRFPTVLCAQLIQSQQWCWVIHLWGSNSSARKGGESHTGAWKVEKNLGSCSLIRHTS